ncbi:MAG: DNA-binding protein [Armatimonadota bacterium]|nr:MAG: DNA-binding protein [Armatimonadota bacterium]
MNTGETTTNWVIPSTLRQLRQQMNLSPQEVEELSRRLQRRYYAPVSKEELGLWESGQSAPQLEHLETLSEIYRCPVGYFFMKDPPQRQLPLSFRGLSQEKERLSFTTLQSLHRFMEMADLLVTLVEEQGIVWHVHVERSDTRDVDLLVSREQQRLGFNEQIRKQWESPEEAFLWWRSRIEQLGVFCMQMRLDPKEIRGASLWGRSRYPFILVNHQDVETATGRMFTLLHEYAHLITTPADEEGIACDFYGREGTHGVEPLANRFAARMLLPRELLEDRLKQLNRRQFQERWSDKVLDEIRAPLLVSRHVVLIMLQEMGLAPPDLYRQKREQWEQQKLWARPRSGKGVTQRERKLRELGFSAIRVLLKASEQGFFSPVDLADILEMKVAQAYQFLEWARSEVG